MWKTIMLISSENESFEVEEAVALQSKTIAQMIEGGCDENEVVIANVTGDILSLVIEYCKKHVEYEGDYSSSIDLKMWDDEFVNVEQYTIFQVMCAAHYLNIKDLLDLTIRKIADQITGKSPHQIQAFLNVTNVFTPEELAR